MTKRIAIILFNLGGPASLEGVESFLLHLFNDPAIIRLPRFFRWLLAKWITARRLEKAKHIYAQMGGKSPILEQTEAQKDALVKVTQGLIPEAMVKGWVSMRYAGPRSADILPEVMAFQPDLLLLVPLYPQFSTTTTASSFQEWDRLAKAASCTIPTRRLCCYPAAEGLIQAHVALIREAYQTLPSQNRAPVLLFSAHGLPEKVIRSGDPYQWQIEATCRAIGQALDIRGLESVIGYQSRVGPMKWTQPYTDALIRQFGKEGRSLIMVPIAFVSEHSETLVELDIDYRLLAESVGVPHYVRVPAVGCHPAFIRGLAEICYKISQGSEEIGSAEGGRICEKEKAGCLCKIVVDGGGK